MSSGISSSRRAIDRWMPDLKRGFENLLLHKMRSFLTMLGMIFGVAAVVSMMSIGAGAQQQVMAFIEDLGVRNLIVEARESTDPQALQKVRRVSPGLTFQDLRIIRANVPQLEDASPRKRFAPTKLIPKPQRETPVVYGVEPSYRAIASVRLTGGRFFDEEEAASAAPVCLLGSGARTNLFGAGTAIGEFIKVNEQWFRVIGTIAPQLTVQGDVGGLPAQDRNNVLYVPTRAAIFRLEDSYSRLKDEIDGLYLQLRVGEDSEEAAEVVRAILAGTHRGADDHTVIVPAELLAEQRRTRRIFEVVMVALASISLLVGGIGIMNIMLASVLERTPEIGVRRALGATRRDIVRQFVIETVMISLIGGLIGVVFGFGMSRTIASLAGWSTIVTSSSVGLALAVSLSVGVIFGVYPAIKASRLDPIEALRYE
jgi:putative ABC transport system permease protein